MDFKFFSLSLLTAISISCGSNGSSGGSSGGPESEGGNSEIPTDPQHEKGKYYIFMKEGIDIPFGNFPSMKTEGEFVKACDPGQSYFLDRCFDKMIVDYDNFAVSFENKDSERTNALSENFVNHDYFQTLLKTNDRLGGELFESILSKIQHVSEDRRGGILNPIRYITTDSNNRLNGYRAVFNTSWGFVTTTKIKHEYKLNGTAIVGGKEYPFPITTSILEEAYPDFKYDRRYIEGFGEMTVFKDYETKEVTEVLFVFHTSDEQ